MPHPPPVEQVNPGLWSLPVPIPNNPLGYTLVYAIESDRGPVLVDTGWDDPSTLDALERGMVEAGFHLAEVYGVLVTHHHPDHHGLSGTVRERSGAWIAMHAADAEIVGHAQNLISDYFVQAAATLLEAGASEQDLAQLPSPEQVADLQPSAPAVPNRLILDGEKVDVPGWEVRAHHTPGHTPGHVCFEVTRYEALLSGDHVLPTISPHIGLFDEAHEDDPLGWYLGSLERLRQLDIREVLPAHQYRFDALDGRLNELLSHHEQRLTAIRQHLQGGPSTAWEVAERMPWNRAWEDIPPLMKRAALAEALAHLRLLERRGEVAVDAGTSPTTFQLA